MKADDVDLRAALETLPMRLLAIMVGRGPVAGFRMTEELSASRPEISRAANSLVAAGYASRATAYDDNRQKMFAATARGRAVCLKARALLRLLREHEREDAEHARHHRRPRQPHRAPDARSRAGAGAGAADG